MTKSIFAELCGDYSSYKTCTESLVEVSSLFEKLNSSIEECKHIDKKNSIIKEYINVINEDGLTPSIVATLEANGGNILSGDESISLKEYVNGTDNAEDVILSNLNEAVKLYNDEFELQFSNIELPDITSYLMDIKLELNTFKAIFNSNIDWNVHCDKQLSHTYDPTMLIRMLSALNKEDDVKENYEKVLNLSNDICGIDLSDTVKTSLKSNVSYSDLHLNLNGRVLYRTCCEAVDVVLKNDVFKTENMSKEDIVFNVKKMDMLLTSVTMTLNILRKLK